MHSTAVSQRAGVYWGGPLQRVACKAIVGRKCIRSSRSRPSILRSAGTPSETGNEVAQVLESKETLTAETPLPAPLPAAAAPLPKPPAPRGGVLRVLGATALAASLLGPWLLNPAASAAAGAAQPVAAVAALSAVVSAGDTAWVLTSTALVLFMTIPGLSLFYAGLVRQKNALSVLVQCFAITCISTVLWASIGYSLCFSSTGMIEGVVTPAAFLGNLDKAFLSGVTSASVVGTIPEALWFMFQLTFAIITPALMVGAFVERMKFSAVAVFCTLFSLFIYYPACHMVWGGPGAYFADLGVLDFAGGIVVHITAGMAALVASIMVGPRKENSLEPHSLALTVAGAGALWVGWFGFNAGSAGAATALAASAMMVTQISASMGALVWTMLDINDPELGKPTALGIATGSIAGLASITPASGFVGVYGAFVIGTVSAVVCRWFATVVKSKYKFDDSLDVFSVHGVGGFLGTILLGIFAHPQFGGNQVGLIITNQLGLQSFAAVATALYSAVVSVGLLKVTSLVCNGLRVSATEEALGLDNIDHGEVGYILSSTGSMDDLPAAAQAPKPALA